MTRGLMLGSEHSEFQVIVLILCPIRKNGNSEFFSVNENIVQVCPVFSKPRVNAIP